MSVDKKTLAKYAVSSRRLASIAGRGIRYPERITEEEVLILCASVLSQKKEPKA